MFHSLKTSGPFRSRVLSPASTFGGTVDAAMTGNNNFFSINSSTGPSIATTTFMGEVSGRLGGRRNIRTWLRPARSTSRPCPCPTEAPGGQHLPGRQRQSSWTLRHAGTDPRPGRSRQTAPSDAEDDDHHVAQARLIAAHFLATGFQAQPPATGGDRRRVTNLGLVRDDVAHVRISSLRHAPIASRWMAAAR